MSKMRAQRGVGMVEVLVALLLLAIGVLGFTALQLRAVGASIEASSQILALNLARDLTERMRANPQAIQCKSYTVGKITQSTVAATCTNGAAAQAQATKDLQNAFTQANNQGMVMVTDTCPAKASSRQCVYVAWDKTAASFGSKSDCYDSDNNTYKTGTTCLFLEAY